MEETIHATDGTFSKMECSHPHDKPFRSEKEELEFWKKMNRQQCDKQSVIGFGSWIEADKTGY